LDLAFCFSAARWMLDGNYMRWIARRRKTKGEGVGGVSGYKQATPLGF